MDILRSDIQTSKQYILFLQVLSLELHYLPYSTTEKWNKMVNSTIKMVTPEKINYASKTSTFIHAR